MDVFYTFFIYLKRNFQNLNNFIRSFNTSKFTYKSFNESHSLTNIKNKQILKISINNLHEDF